MSALRQAMVVNGDEGVATIDTDPTGPGSEVTVVVERTLDVPRWAALSVVQDIELLGYYEPKVTRLSVSAAAPGCGSYEARGRFLGVVPWRGTFEFVLTDVGFRSWTVEPIGGVSVAGGFAVDERDDGSCVLTHDESYLLPRDLGRLTPLLQRHIERTMCVELSRIETLAVERVTATVDRRCSALLGYHPSA